MRVSATLGRVGIRGAIVRGLIAGVLLALLADGGHAEITPYPRVPGDEANSDHVSVRVNGVEVDTVGTSMNVGYAHFAFAETAKVKVAAKEPIETSDLSSHRLKIPASVAGNGLTLQPTEPRKLHLRINGLSRFFIFAEPPETGAPQRARSETNVAYAR